MFDKLCHEFQARVASCKRLIGPSSQGSPISAGVTLLGTVEIPNRRQPVGLTRLCQAIVDRLGLKLLDRSAELDQESLWAENWPVTPTSASSRPRPPRPKTTVKGFDDSRVP
jgi:hypothetical protein